MIDRSEFGSATVEMALLAPVLVILLLFVVAVGRLSVAHQEVDNAAVDAARAASMASSPEGATQAADQAVSADLSADGLTCPGFATSVKIGDFVAGGNVGVQVSCTTSLSGLSLLRIPGSETLTSSATAPIDLYRGIAP